MSYQNYVNFFSKRTFASDAVLEFFKDGSFAIKSGNQIELYGSDCNIVETLCGGRYEILSNGIIINIKSGVISATHNGTKRLEGLNPIYYHSNSSVVVSGSMILIRKCKSKVHAVYEYDENGDFVEKQTLDFVDGATLSASEDGSVYAIREYEKTLIFNKNGENLLGKTIISGKDRCCLDAEVLGCGSFIVRTNNFEYKLYDKTGKLLCTSSSLRKIGGDYLVFDEALIIDAKNGCILGEYDQEIKKMSNDGTRLYSHKLVNKNGVGYMLGGKLMPPISTRRWRPSCSVILSQNRFYVLDLYHMPFLEGPIEYVNKLLMLKPHN